MLETIMAERYSVRDFQPQQIPADRLEQILAAGRLAPTAQNRQPYQIYVAQSQQSLTELREITRCAFNAPTVLVVCGDTAAAWKNPFDGHCSAEMDASIVTTQMMLRAQELGIGTVWVCYFDRKQVAEYLGLPDHIVPYCLLPMGYAASGAVASPQHSDRKPLAETVFYR